MPTTTCGTSRRSSQMSKHDTMVRTVATVEKLATQSDRMGRQGRQHGTITTTTWPTFRPSPLA
jgi:hypothetical protein